MELANWLIVYRNGTTQTVQAYTIPEAVTRVNYYEVRAVLYLGPVV